MANELLEKLKAAKSKEELSALLKKEATELSPDDLKEVSGGASVEDVDRETLKELILCMADLDMIDMAIQALEDWFGIDYHPIYLAKASALGGNKSVIYFIVENLL